MRVRWLVAVGAAAFAFTGPVSVPALTRPAPPPARSARSGPHGPGPFRERLKPLMHLATQRGGGETHQASALLGHSEEGRPINVRELIGAGWPRRPAILVFGCIHGDECAGTRVVRHLALGCPPPMAEWAVPNLNPDGLAAGTRLNGRGVDLNRNFPAAWRPIGSRWDPEYSGPGPFSEVETRLAAHLIEVIHPRVTIWFHQEADQMVRAWGQSVPAARRFAKLSGLPFRRLPWPAGTAPHWQNTDMPGSRSFVVELPPGPLTLRQANRFATAVFRMGEGRPRWRHRL